MVSVALPLQLHAHRCRCAALPPLYKSACSPRPLSLSVLWQERRCSCPLPGYRPDYRVPLHSVLLAPYPQQQLVCTEWLPDVIIAACAESADYICHLHCRLFLSAPPARIRRHQEASRPAVPDATQSASGFWRLLLTDNTPEEKYSPAEHAEDRRIQIIFCENLRLLRETFE